MSDDLIGTQDQGTGASDYNAATFHIQQEIEKISTATLVKIVRAPYDKDGNDIVPGTAGPIGYVDVQPMINQIDGRGKATPHGTVYRLSYFRYQGGHGAFISDPKKDDIGKMICADRDTSSVRATNAVANPGSRRKYDRADGTFFGQPQAGAPTQHFAWLERGFDMRDAFGNTLVGTADGVLINGCLITIAGDVVSKPSGIHLDTHTHNSVMTGGDHTNRPDTGT